MIKSNETVRYVCVSFGNTYERFALKGFVCMHERLILSHTHICYLLNQLKFNLAVVIVALEVSSVALIGRSQWAFLRPGVVVAWDIFEGSLARVADLPTLLLSLTDWLPW